MWQNGKNDSNMDVTSASARKKVIVVGAGRVLGLQVSVRQKKFVNTLI